MTDGHDIHDESSTTPVSLRAASWSDPHLQPASQHPEHMERVIALVLTFGVAGFVLFGVAYWQNWNAWTLGASLGIGMLLIGVGMTAWGKYLMPRGPFVEDRHPLNSPKEEVDAFTNALVERGAAPVRRRKLLGGILGVGLGIFGVVAAFPLIRSLGPLPGDSLDTTNWREGSYIVDRAGRRQLAAEIGVGSVIPSAFPEGFQDDEEAQAQDVIIVIHVASAPLANAGSLASQEPGGFMAFSKMCTHAGCPVGLYEREQELLVCPCHQSMFNVRENAEPVFGPAPRPLPRLPIYIDKQGYLRASGGFNQPVGPGFWERTT